MTTPIRSRRRAGLAAGLVVGAAALLGLAGPVAANEFPPNPEASIVAACDPTPGFSYTLTNIGGLTTADFTIEVVTVDGTASTTQQVAVDESTTLHAEVPEDTTGTVTITSQGMDPVSLSEVVDCFDAPSATIVPTCGLNGAAVSFTLDDPDDQVTEWAITIDGQTQTFADDVFFQYGSLFEGDAWDAVVTADGVEVASESGVVDCVQPAAEIELVCTGAGPDLVIRLHADDVTRTTYDVTWPEVSREDGAIGSGSSTVDVEPGADVHVITWPLPREVDYDVAVASPPDGLLADLAGSSGCPDIGVLPGGPVEVTPLDVPTVTPSVTPIDGSGGWTAPDGTRYDALARTGSETPYLVALGVGLLAAGVVMTRLGRRLLTRP
jgi:hypothetical protein